jgi:hypothetical protein
MSVGKKRMLNGLVSTHWKLTDQIDLTIEDDEGVDLGPNGRLVGDVLSS